MATRTRSTSSKGSSSRRGGSGAGSGSQGGRGSSGRKGAASKSTAGRKSTGAASKASSGRKATSARKGASGSASGSRKTAAKRGTSSGGSSSRKPSGSSSRKSASASRGSGGSRGSRASSSRASRTPVGQAIEMLSNDHRMVEKLFRQGERAKKNKAQLREIVDACCAALTLHAEIEEQYFYPVMRESGGSDAADMIAEADVEHASAKQLIAQLEGGDAGDEQYAATFKVLGEYVKHHVKEEENEIFPKARRARGDFEPLLEALMARDAALEGGAGQQGGRSTGSGGREASGNDGGRDSGATARNATRGRGGRSRSSGETGGEDMQQAGGEAPMSSEGESSRRARRGGQADTEDVESISRGRDEDEETTRGSRQGGR